MGLVFPLLFYLPVTESATFRETGPRGPEPQPKSLGLWEHVGFYLFIYLFFRTLPHIFPAQLQGEAPFLFLKPGHLTVRHFRSFGLTSSLGGGDIATQPLPQSSPQPRWGPGWRKQSLSFLCLLILYVCVPVKEAVCCFIPRGCGVLCMVSLYIPDSPWALPRREGISQKREKSTP